MNYQVLLLCKKRTIYSSIVLKLFEKYDIPCRMILDYPIVNRSKGSTECYKDQDLIDVGFVGFQDEVFRKLIKDPGAWEKSFYYLRDNLRYDYYWFMEDDVYSSNLVTFIKLFEKMNNDTTDLISGMVAGELDDPEWRFWEKDSIFPAGKRFRSINCLCRLSKRLVSEVLALQQLHGTFISHESMFAGACINNGWKVIDFLGHAELSKFFYDYSPWGTRGEIPDDCITHAIKPIVAP